MSTTWITPLDWLTLAIVTLEVPPLASTIQTLPSLSFTVRSSPSAVFSFLPSVRLEASSLTYHVVAGKMNAADLTDGKKLKTVEGEQLTVKRSGDTVMIVDAKGGSSTVTIANVNQSNGVIHVVDTVLLPAS